MPRDAPAERREGGATRPVEPVGPVAPEASASDETVVPVDEQPQAPRERQVASVGGPRERLTGSELEGEGTKRFSAVDVEDIVLPKDEVKQQKGWPWWAWGLLAVGVVGVAGGGYFAAREAGVLGGSHKDATVTITW